MSALAEVRLLGSVCSCGDCTAIEALVAESGGLVACGVASEGYWCECTPGCWQPADPVCLCTHTHALALAELVPP